jgi:HPt (histidine-containing phosphotransfer) domain-containing protein
MTEEETWREAPVVDVAAVERLRSLRAQVEREGEDVLSELLDLFHRDTVTRLEKLRAPVKPDDVKHAAHALKGAALNVGAARVAALAQYIEKSGNAALNLIDTLADEVKTAEAELRTRLAP